MLIKTLTVGYLETNCYIVTDEDTNKCAVIDPGAESGTILDYIEQNALTVEAIFLTHGHFDHCIALNSMMEGTGAPAYINMKDIVAVARRGLLSINETGRLDFYVEGDIIKTGGLEFTVLETPGHSPGSVTLKCGPALFTGDTLFRDGCGRTDLSGGDVGALLASLRRLALLDGDYEVYPGHAATTTLSRERSFNYAVRHALNAAQ